MQLIQQHRCTMMSAVPAMLIVILNHPKVEEFDLSSLKEVLCGAAPLPVETARAFSERFDCRVREGYGLTESTAIATANRRSEPYRPGSAGRACINHEVRIFDENDQPLPSGETGEIVIRGPAVMKGYYNLPKETEKALKGGWLHTGDMGHMDGDGFLYIVDRKKDMIIRGGENIYPAELEGILYEHPGVAEAAIIGVSDAVYGENVVAFVVTKPGENPSEKGIIDFMLTRTSSFKVPSKIYFIDALPKTAAGKVLKRKLRERVAREGK